jgi:hypothetical protein
VPFFRNTSIAKKKKNKKIIPLQRFEHHYSRFFVLFGKIDDSRSKPHETISLFGWLVADGWCWFVLREEYCWLVAGDWFVMREKYCWLVVDKPNEQGGCIEMDCKLVITE